MKILVLGGTRFFGKVLVELLLRKGHTVTIATRGKTQDEFYDKVNRLIIDRNDIDTLRSLTTEDWDIIFDQTCFSPAAAIASCEIFKGRVNRYVFTSSQVVYDSADFPVREEDFNPYNYEVNKGIVFKENKEMSYSDGKKLCEAIFFQKNAFPVVAIRFPIVLGINDHTNRLVFHIERISQGRAIGIPIPNALVSFISSLEAARLLYWVAVDQSSIVGPLNACSTGEISLRNFIHIIEKEVGKQAIIVPETGVDVLSPYILKMGSWYMDNSKAKNAGFEFSKLEDWLPTLIHIQAEMVEKI